MIRKMHLIYVTGLGDANPRGQRVALRLWPIYGIEAEFFQVAWADDESWKSKFARLLASVDAAHAAGKDVYLVGVSAGASAAINVYAARQREVRGVVLLAGKVNHPETIGEFYRREMPAFVASAKQCAEALSELSPEARRRILSRYAWHDGRVAAEDSIIAGAHNRRVFGFGHAPFIGLQITFGVASFVRFLRHLQK